MKIIRVLLALTLVVFATFNFNSSSLAATTSTTSQQIQSIQKQLPQLEELRGRMDKVGTLIQKKRWVDAKDYIHGPLGDLRRTLAYISRDFAPKDKAEAKEIAKTLLLRLVNIDKACDEGNFAQATSQYAELVRDFDAFLKLVPKS